jgi:hypothetical protein
MILLEPFLTFLHRAAIFAILLPLYISIRYRNGSVVRMWFVPLVAWSILDVVLAGGEGESGWRGRVVTSAVYDISRLRLCGTGG